MWAMLITWFFRSANRTSAAEEYAKHLPKKGDPDYRRIAS